MRRSFYRLLLLCCLLCFRALPLALAAPGDEFFTPSFGDYAAELATARQQGKQGILLMLEAEGCPYCKRMREQVLSQEAVRRYYRDHFATFSVDVNGSVTVIAPDGKEQTEKALAGSLRVRGTPTFVFFAPDGREIARHVGATRDAAAFLALGRYVAEGHWRKMTFEQFVRGMP